MSVRRIPGVSGRGVTRRRSARSGVDIGYVDGLVAHAHLDEDALGMTEAALTLRIPGQDADEGGGPAPIP